MSFLDLSLFLLTAATFCLRLCGSGGAFRSFWLFFRQGCRWSKSCLTLRFSWISWNNFCCRFIFRFSSLSWRSYTWFSYWSIWWSTIVWIIRFFRCNRLRIIESFQSLLFSLSFSSFMIKNFFLYSQLFFFRSLC